MLFKNTIVKKYLTNDQNVISGRVTKMIGEVK